MNVLESLAVFLWELEALLELESHIYYHALWWLDCMGACMYYVASKFMHGGCVNSMMILFCI